MLIIPVSQRVKYLGYACLLMPMLIGTSFSALANPPPMQEAAPPWAGSPLSADVPSDPPVTSEIPAYPTAMTNTEVQATLETGASIETWYRNRRQAIAAVQPINLAELEAAAEAGDTNAQYRLALQYRSGDNPNPDIVKSLQWQQKAAQGGHEEAQYGLGNLYANGQYVVADQSLARHWFNRAAKQGHVAAKLALLSLDNGNPPQALAASSQLQDAAVAPTLASSVEPAQTPLQTSEPTELASAAPISVDQAPLTLDDNGHAGSVGNKGVSASNDLSGLDPSVIKQSAESGDKQAQLILGTLYEDGVGGLPANLREAAYWYEQAAKQDFPKAQYNLGLLYEDGRGVKQSDQQAAYWYDRAAQAGFAEAQNNLGVLYILGKGVKKDAKRAEQLFAASAAQGNADAQRNLDMLRQKR